MPGQAKVAELPPTSPVKHGPVAWPDVFKKLYNDGVKVFGYDDLVLGAQTIGYVDVRKSSCRTVMMGYVDRGSLERDRPGHFSLTAKGRAESGADTASKNDAAFHFDMTASVATEKNVRSILPGLGSTAKPELGD